MYEFQLVGRLNNDVQLICNVLHLRRVNRVLVKIGALRKANPEALSFIFSSAARGTPAEGANFSIMIIPATFKCYDCGKTGTTDSTEYMCPHCGSRNVDLLTGLELSVDFLEVEC